MSTTSSSAEFELDRCIAAGKLSRKILPRSKHSAVELPDRDPVAILEEQNRTRVESLVPIRMGRMAQSPFSFYRGAAAVMANDLADSPVTGVRVVACGDAHLANFGLFASPERRVLFDLNDFDEAHPAPWEWDVRRLAASIWIHGRDNSHTESQCRRSVESALVAYQGTLQSLFALPTTDRYYFEVETGALERRMGKDVLGLEAVVKKARKRTSQRVLQKVTTVSANGQSTIRDEFPVIRHPERFDLDEMQGLFETYRRSVRADIRFLLAQYQLVDYAMRIVGVGSVGTRCWLFYLQGPCGEPLFLQAKEAPASVLQTYGRIAEVPGSEMAAVTQQGGQGLRVVSAQRILQAQSDPFLGWVSSVTVEDGVQRDFYVRQFRDMKGSIDLATLTAPRAAAYASLCGALLARAHSQSPRSAFITGYLATGRPFVEAISKWSRRYADRTEQDYELLQHAIRTGRLAAESGV